MSTEQIFEITGHNILMFYAPSHFDTHHDAMDLV